MLETYILNNAKFVSCLCTYKPKEVTTVCMASDRVRYKSKYVFCFMVVAVFAAFFFDASQATSSAISRLEIYNVSM